MKLVGLETLTQLIKVLTESLNPSSKDRVFIQLAPTLFVTPPDQVSVLDADPYYLELRNVLKGYETMTAESLIQCADDQIVARAITLAYQIFQSQLGGNAREFIKSLSKISNAGDAPLLRTLIRQRAKIETICASAGGREKLKKSA